MLHIFLFILQVYKNIYSTTSFSCSTGRIITLINIYGRKTSLSRVEHTNDRIWRQVWTDKFFRKFSFFFYCCLLNNIFFPVYVMISNPCLLTIITKHAAKKFKGPYLAMQSLFAFTYS